MAKRKIESGAPTAASVMGRPRSGAVHRKILEVALRQVGSVGFRALTTDGVAQAAGVAKTTLYRRWPNKAAMVMDAFLTIIGPASAFPQTARALQSVRQQMRLQARFFRSRHGKIIKALLGEAQFDRELATEFRERWIGPRRRMTHEVLERAVQQGDLNAGLDLEAMIDMLYGPLYYRLQLETGPITEAFTDTIFEQVMRGAASGGWRESPAL